MCRYLKVIYICTIVNYWGNYKMNFVNTDVIKLTKTNKVTFKSNDLPFSVIEEIKLIRTNIEYSGADTKVILFTSSTQSEGKSTISYELCRSIAELGKKVLLIDTDMRRSDIHNHIEGEKPRGLSYYLSGQSDLETVLCETNTPNMFCIAAGRVPPNPAELLSSKRMANLMEWARLNFDYVIVDTPPINLVVDASIIASYSDASVIVCKAGAIPRKAAQNVVKQLQRVNCPIIGVVLNQVASSNKGYYKKYGYYGDDVDVTKFAKTDSKNK